MGGLMFKYIAKLPRAGGGYVYRYSSSRYGPASFRVGRYQRGVVRSSRFGEAKTLYGEGREVTSYRGPHPLEAATATRVYKNVSASSWRRLDHLSRKIGS